MLFLYLLVLCYSFKFQFNNTSKGEAPTSGGIGLVLPLGLSCRVFLTILTNLRAKKKSATPGHLKQVRPFGVPLESQHCTSSGSLEVTLWI